MAEDAKQLATVLEIEDSVSRAFRAYQAALAVRREKIERRNDPNHNASAGVARTGTQGDIGVR
jgi:hypothetical protein